jgi:hypothetical protein
MSDFLQAVTEAFNGLLTQGLLSVESSTYDAQAFGNSVVVFVSQNFRVRVIRDRGEVFAEAASRLCPETWFPLQRVIRAVGVSAPPPEGLLTPKQAAAIVEQNFNDLDSGLGSAFADQTTTTLAELERSAMKRLMDLAKDTK